MKPRLLRVQVALLLVVGAAGACRRDADQPRPAATDAASEEPHESRAARVRLTAGAISDASIGVWNVRPVDIGRMLVLTGTVGYDENRLLQVAANVRGRVSAIPVDLGARVSEGDPLLVLESVDLGKAREDFLSALSSLRVSVCAYERAKSLLDGKAISVGEFQAREGEYLSRKTAADSAERTLRLYGQTDQEIESLRESIESNGTTRVGDGARLTLRAPFAGRVIDRKVTPGALFEALQPLLTLADLRTVWIFLQAYEKDLSLVREGLTATIRTEAYTEQAFRGRVDFVGSVLDPATRSVRVRATVANPSESLRPGMFVRAALDVPRPAAEAKTVTAVPQAALQTLEGRTIVFVRVEPGVFERRFVEVGHSFEGFAEVLGGVKDGDAVVTDGSFVLKSQLVKASLGEQE